MAPIVAAALPWVTSAVGTMLPAIINSFRSGKSPEEAQKQIAPQRQALVDRLVGSGMTGPAAEAMADEAMADELAKAQLPEEMNPWLSMALSIGGAVGGWKAGKMLGSKFGPKADAKASAVDTPAEQALTKPASGQVPEFLPGEMPMAKRPSKELRPWEDMPEVQRAMAEKAAGGPFPEPRKPGEAFAWADEGSMRGKGEWAGWVPEQTARPQGAAFAWAESPFPKRPEGEWAVWATPPAPAAPRSRLMDLMAGAEPTMRERMAQAMYPG